GGLVVGVCRVRVQRHQRAGDSANGLAVPPRPELLLVLGPGQNSAGRSGGTGGPADTPGRRGCAPVKQDRHSSEPYRPAPPRSPWLERVTADALALVVVDLGWVVWMSYLPEWGRLPSVEGEVLLVLGFLALALALVSWVALVHTRPGR